MIRKSKEFPTVALIFSRKLAWLIEYPYQIPLLRRLFKLIEFYEFLRERERERENGRTEEKPDQTLTFAHWTDSGMKLKMCQSTIRRQDKETWVPVGSNIDLCFVLPSGWQGKARQELVITCFYLCQTKKWHLSVYGLHFKLYSSISREGGRNLPIL